MISILMQSEEVRGMNLTVFSVGDEVYRNCECIKGYTFKMIAPRGKSAHMTGIFAQLQGDSVKMTVLNASYRMHAS